MKAKNKKASDKALLVNVINEQGLIEFVNIIDRREVEVVLSYAGHQASTLVNASKLGNPTQAIIVCTSLAAIIADKILDNKTE